MDADENPEIAAALAKLAEQDAVAAEDARAALEWIAGEQGLALITQERIQTPGRRGACPRAGPAAAAAVRRHLPVPDDA